jgi:diphthamide synthase (EF-2-diphthine--ammonia ligase)
MKIAVLFSGGKDSVRTVHFCLEKKYDVKYLVTILSKKQDSWLYHTPNIELTELSAEALGIPLISKETQGIKEKELEDLKNVLKVLDVDTICCGGIFSNYQKTRFEKVCKELNLDFMAPFWQTDSEKFLKDTIDLGFDVRIVGVYLKDTIDLGFDVRIVGVYAEGLEETWLGRKLDEKTLEELKKLNKKFGISLVGEGGEYETFVVDGPIFKKRIEIIDSEKVWDKKTQGGYLKIKETRLV